MRSTLTVLLTVLLAGTSMAQSRPSTLTMTCGQAAATVATYGAVVMTTGQHTFDRFVAHQGFCLPGEVADRATAPTLDSPNCAVGYTCEQRRHLFHDDF